MKGRGDQVALAPSCINSIRWFASDFAGGAGDEHHTLGNDAVLAQPVRGELAPVRRFFREIEGMHAVGKRESLARRGIAARRDDPDRRLAARNDARRRAATRRHEHDVARHGVERVLDQRCDAVAAAVARAFLHRSRAAPRGRARPVRLGERGDLREHRHRFLGKFSHRRLAREHDAIRPVEDRVRDIGRLRARRQPAADHRLEHLRRGDDRFAREIRLRDELLLRVRDLLDRHLHAEIAARDHDAVGGGEDFVEVRKRIGALDLRDDEWHAPESSPPPRAPLRCPSRARRTTGSPRPRPRRAQTPGTRDRAP